MLRPFDAFLAAQAVVVLDGALATELEHRGADLRDPLWSAKVLVEQPDMIRAVHRDYFDAGADVATTATYQATFEGFARRGIAADAAARLMHGAVSLAAQARDEFWEAHRPRTRRTLGTPGTAGAPGTPATSGTPDTLRLRPLVAASIGPYGAMLADGSEYRGHYALDDAALKDFHRRRLRVLAGSGADVLACETIPCLREARILAELLEEFPAMSAWISFSCQDGSRNCEGEDIAACAAALDPFPQIAAVGVNCTRPERVASLLRRMRGETAKPLIAYPNSGERYDAAAKCWNGSAHGPPFAALSGEWFDAGARIIGGCCRTTPNDIAALRACLA